MPGEMAIIRNLTFFKDKMEKKATPKSGFLI